MRLRFEVSAFNAKAVAAGLRAQSFDATLETRRAGSDVVVVAVDADTSTIDEIRAAVTILASDHVEVDRPR